MRLRGALALVALLQVGQAAAADVELHSAWVRALPPIKKPSLERVFLRRTETRSEGARGAGGDA